ncbi:MAG: shikimate kinase [Candidatus Dormibacteraceae bacterium]
MGSGKSTVGERVAARAGAGFSDLDDMVVEVHGASIAEIFESAGEPAFRRLEEELLPRALERGGVIAVGGGTPMADAGWRLLRSRSLTVWLDAPLEVLLARVGEDAGRPLLRGSARSELERLLSGRRARYAEAERRVDADRPILEVVEEVVRLWSG